MSSEKNNTAIARLRDRFGERVSTGESILAAHGRDASRFTPSPPDAVVFPETTEDVAAIVQICALHGCPIVPFGIGSSLEGHVIPIRGGVSLDMSNMNRIFRIYDEDLCAVVQPGVTREQLNMELRDSGLMFTVDPGANASLGGMAATRASGTNTVRYGTMADNVLALEVVTPDGHIIRTGSRARKSSTGYDLTKMFVGSEGTLGVITELTVRLYGRPEHIAAATCHFATIDDAVRTVICAIQSGIPMARIEFLDETQMRGMNLYNPALALPEKPHLFLEFHGSEPGVARDIEHFGDVAREFGVSDLAFASTTEERNRLWKARHEAYFAARGLRAGATPLITDCCVPISALAECIARARELVDASGLLAPIGGHVGDGNFHLALLLEPGNAMELEVAERLVGELNDLAISFGGTISGEHGIGFGKIPYMKKQHGDAYEVMRRFKKALDPQNLFNPGKMFPLG